MLFAFLLLARIEYLSLMLPPRSYLGRYSSNLVMVVGFPRAVRLFSPNEMHAVVFVVSLTYSRVRRKTRKFQSNK